MTPSDWILIVVAIAAVGALVGLVTVWKVNAFLSLAIASLLVGTGATMMGIQRPNAERPLDMLGVVEAFGTGMGRTLGSIAAVIGLGTMLGKLLAESGGAQVLAKRFAAIFGPRRVTLCIMVIAIVVGLPTWFAVGLVLLLPILLTLTHETKKPFLLLAIPLLSCLSIMHGLMPPHPGPVAAIGLFKTAGFEANMGLVLLWGFVIGLPTAIIAGPIFAKRAVRIIAAEAPPATSSPEVTAPRTPGFGITLWTILLPVVLMLTDTLAKLLLPPGTGLGKFAAFIGNPTIALLISVLVASWTLGTRCGFTGAQVLKFTEQAIASIGMVLLVVGGGGGFARVLDEAGVAAAMGKLAAAASLPPLLYGWLVAAFIRVATGSATVAITAASGLVASVLGQYPGVNVELLIIAIGCGSLFLSHLNDGGFWIVKDCLGLTVGQTLRTWTVTETIIGIVGLGLTLLIDALI